MYENFRSINSFPWEKKKSWSIPHVKSLVGKYIVCIICKIIYTNNIGFFFLRILHTVHLPPIVITKCFFMWFSCQSFFDRLKKKKMVWIQIGVTSVLYLWASACDWPQQTKDIHKHKQLQEWWLSSCRNPQQLNHPFWKKRTMYFWYILHNHLLWECYTLTYQYILNIEDMFKYIGECNWTWMNMLWKVL